LATSLKVGALAKRTGLTVRTLHHYDEIGLLSPSDRTPSGHRLYGERDVARLHQIASLRHLGLPLDEIRECLTRPEYSLERALDLQIERIESQIARQERLRDLVSELRDRLRAADEVSIEDLTRTIEVTVSHEKYYTPAQLKRLERRAAEVGEDRIRAVQQEWTELFAAFRDAMDRSVDPASEEVRSLARKSAALIEEFTGGDPGIASSLAEMYQGDGAVRTMESRGMDMAPGLWEYMGRARRALEQDG
jgi:DNA-binding transcriptional MerR regulator